MISISKLLLQGTVKYNHYVKGVVSNHVNHINSSKHMQSTT